eukprot:TRINITY_DN263_c0_g1_i1.p1 TRINITY_DN263_c0_g1~~TRINITY_DN263_c0_g1_i1.p1  ORF type:complete len:327 (+),score=59.81 TRINITY_DN263_c0_g1_i1:62-982(+)
MTHSESDTRRQYRELVERSSSHTGSKDLLEDLNIADTLFNGIKDTRTAAVDSELLVGISKSIVDHATQVKTGVRNYQPTDYCDRMLKMASGVSGIEDGDCSYHEIDWDALFKRIRSGSHHTVGPRFQSMYGPMGVEVKKRVVKARQEKVVDKESEMQKPEEVEGEEGDKDGETTLRVNTMHTALEKAEDVDFWEFVTDKDDFGRTVENIFHFAFLVHQGNASLVQDDLNTRAGIKKTNQTEKEKQKRSQYVLSFDYKTWMGIKEKKNLKVQHITPYVPKDTKKSSKKRARNEKDDGRKGSKKKRKN